MHVALGSLLVAVALLDVAWTTVAAGSGGGPLTVRIARQLWRGALAVHRRRDSHTLLSVAGVAIVFVLLGVWIVLTVGGWSLVFNGSEGAVRTAQEGRPAGGLERVYFAGYTVFTLGNGELRPGAGGWQLATVAASGTGLVLVTLSITYLVPVASAVAERRQLASTIGALGSSPHAIVTRAWTGEDFGSLSQHLVSLMPVVERARQQHATYPVLHYFHSQDPASAAAPNLVNLDDALLLLQAGVAPEVRPDRATLLPLAESIGAFLESLRASYITPQREAHPSPSLEPLRRAGIPVVGDAAYVERVAELRDRRRLLAALLVDDGWSAAPRRHPGR